MKFSAQFDGNKLSVQGDGVVEAKPCPPHDPTLQQILENQRATLRQLNEIAAIVTGADAVLVEAVNKIAAATGQKVILQLLNVIEQRLVRIQNEIGVNNEPSK